MRDQTGRKIDYLRISVTDRCNFRCTYCMPADGIAIRPENDILRFEEIVRIAEAAAELGIRHLKITGGEPLVRRQVAALIGMLKKVDGIEKVTLTTNGSLLEQNLPKLLEAGLDAVNISLDTMDPKTFCQITGSDALEQVLSSIKACCDAGIRTKVNAVSLQLGEENIRALLEIARNMPVDVRFIEMMPIGLGRNFPVVDHRQLLDFLKEECPDLVPDPSAHGFGPAVYYKVPGFQGGIGLISAIHGKFCATCNRVRLTSQGYLKTCLCYDDGADLRAILRSETGDREPLKDAIREAIYRKPSAHCFEQRDAITEHASMNTIGG